MLAIRDGMAWRYLYIVQLCLLALEHDRQSHYPQHNGLQPRMLAQHDGDISYCRNVASNAANDVFFPIQVALACSVEFCVIRNIVVAFRQELL
jgi:hypothetical protein